MYLRMIGLLFALVLGAVLGRAVLLLIRPVLGVPLALILTAIVAEAALYVWLVDYYVHLDILGQGLSVLFYIVIASTLNRALLRFLSKRREPRERGIGAHLS